MEIDDNILQPNAGAFEKDEVRSGPPLSYIAEKLRGALESAHEVWRAINRSGPINLSQSANAPVAAQELGLSSAFSSFRYSMTAFLALHNMLGMIADQKKIDALLDYNHDEFAAWLDRVEREGSILG